ncbi:EamA family transporter RarD, partial [Rhodovulum imhoffii]
RSHRVGWVVLAALAISFNWFLFISAVQTGKAMQASLGYYIFPLVAVVFGVLFRGERLTPVQWLAVGLAALAVLGLTLGLGVVPVISLALALSFGAYGLLKGRVEAGPVLSVTGEVLLLTPLALIWLWAGPAETFGQDWRDSLLLVCSGPLTATPLILFSYAARRISYASVGLIQYINPTLQFLVATFVFGEIFTQWHGLAFGGIWTALALYSVSALRQERALRRAASSASTVGITRM